MSTNLRKAQKHIQRARELLNQSQLGFGVNRTFGPEIHHESQKQANQEKRDRCDGTNSNVACRDTSCSQKFFGKQPIIEGTCFIYAAIGLIVKSLLEDEMLISSHPVLKKLCKVMMTNGTLWAGDLVKSKQRSLLGKEVTDAYNQLLSIYQPNNKESNDLRNMIFGGYEVVLLMSFILTTKKIHTTQSEVDYSKVIFVYDDNGEWKLQIIKNDFKYDEKSYLTHGRVVSDLAEFTNHYVFINHQNSFDAHTYNDIIHANQIDIKLRPRLCGGFIHMKNGSSNDRHVILFTVCHTNHDAVQICDSHNGKCIDGTSKIRDDWVVESVIHVVAPHYVMLHDKMKEAVSKKRKQTE